MLYYVMLYYIILYYFILFCIILNYIILYYKYIYIYIYNLYFHITIMLRYCNCKDAPSNDPNQGTKPPDVDQVWKPIRTKPGKGSHWNFLNVKQFILEVPTVYLYIIYICIIYIYIYMYYIYMYYIYICIIYILYIYVLYIYVLYIYVLYIYMYYIYVYYTSISCSSPPISISINIILNSYAQGQTYPDFLVHHGSLISGADCGHRSHQSGPAKPCAVLRPATQIWHVSRCAVAWSHGNLTKT